MDIISQLYHHPLHNTAHYCAYLQRYHLDDFTLLDHYRHLKQILPIVEILEIKMLPHLPDHLRFLLERSTALKKDLFYLKRFIPTKHRDEILPATNDYIAYLNNLGTQQQNEIVIHFLVRLLGDLFGGQGLKQAVIDLYTRKGFQFDPASAAGVSFYLFPAKTMLEVKEWLKTLTFAEFALTQGYAKQAYQGHINIFMDLEKHRQTEAQQNRQRSRFFYPSLQSLATNVQPYLAKLTNLTMNK